MEQVLTTRAEISFRLVGVIESSEMKWVIELLWEATVKSYLERSAQPAGFHEATALKCIQLGNSIKAENIPSRKSFLPPTSSAAKLIRAAKFWSHFCATTKFSSYASVPRSTGSARWSCRRGWAHEAGRGCRRIPESRVFGCRRERADAGCETKKNTRSGQEVAVLWIPVESWSAYQRR